MLTLKMLSVSYLPQYAKVSSYSMKNDFSKLKEFSKDTDNVHEAEKDTDNVYGTYKNTDKIKGVVTIWEKNSFFECHYMSAIKQLLKTPITTKQTVSNTHKVNKSVEYVYNIIYALSYTCIYMAVTCDCLHLNSQRPIYFLNQSEISSDNKRTCMHTCRFYP